MSYKAMTIAMMAGEPVLLTGSPGVGKSSWFADVARSMGWNIEIVIAAIREPSDFSGLPIQGPDGVVHYAPPSWAHRLNTEQPGVLFLDEISTAPPAVQSALLRVVLDRAVGDLQLPKHVTVVAAANPPEEAANGWELTPPLANRFVHFAWADSLDSWSEGMISGWPQTKKQELPKDWDKPANIQLARTAVVSFIRTRPNLRNALPKDEASRGKAWPSNRTWDMAARLLAAARACGLKDSDDIVFELMAGCVGDGPAMEFKKFQEGDELPDPEVVLAHPEKLVLPKRGDRAYALLNSVTAVVISNNTTERWLNGWRVLAKAADMNVADIAASCARMLVKNKPKPTSIPPSEAIRFKDVLTQAGLW
jgi:hypothetical protein